MKRYPKEKGITIIALVITIIILIILAGVTIDTLLGNVGIIKKAKQSTENYEIAQTKEKDNINTLYAELVAQLGSLEEEDTPKDEIVLETADIEISGSKSAESLPAILSVQVTHVDNENGVDITACKYVLNNSSEALGTNTSYYTGGAFNDNEETIQIELTSVASYYLHVLTVDKAGNAIETIKGPITVEGEYHLHIGDSVSGGECYQTEEYHSHEDDCYTACTGKMVYQSSNYNSSQGTYNYTFKCNTCGTYAYRKDIDLNYSTASFACDNKTLTCEISTTTPTYALSCEKTEGVTIDSYSISY